MVALEVAKHVPCLLTSDIGSHRFSSPQDSNGAVEDWEVWGDPGEIARKKEQQLKARLPPEIRREQLAEEWVQCKSTAAAAKARSDKAAHKAAGAKMRELKMEMQRLGTWIDLLVFVHQMP